MAYDDFRAVSKFGRQQLMDFMEVIEDRHARKSTIITSQLPVSSWYEVLAKTRPSLMPYWIGWRKQ